MRTLLRTIGRLVTAPAGREDRNVRRLLALTALEGVVTGGIVTFLPVFLARLGATALTVSLITALPALVAIVLAVPAGALAARWRRPAVASAKWEYLYRCAYLGAIAAVFLDPAVAPTVVVVAWALGAVPLTIGNAVWYSVLADAVEPRRRPLVNGARWALLGLVNAGSVAAFGELLAALPFPEGYALVFGASFVAGVANLWVYARLEVPEQEPPKERHRSPAAALRALLGPLAEGGPFRRYLALNGLARLGIYLPVGLFSIFWVRDLAISDALVGLRTTVGSLALTLGYYLWGRLASRLGHGRVLVLAAAGLACYPLLTAVTTRETLGLLLVAALVWGAFAGGVEVALFELLVLAAAGERRLRFFAVNIALTNLVALGGPVVGAALAETWGIPAALLVAAGALLLCAGLAARWQAAPT